jgi:formylglycine-generating enzyme required for sulfatase activity
MRSIPDRVRPAGALVLTVCALMPCIGIRAQELELNNPRDQQKLEQNVAGFRDQPIQVLKEFAKGPHTGPIEEALIGVEVTDTARDLKTTQTRRSNGLMIRCDGFLLAPTGVASYSMVGQDQDADHQVIEVVLHPGTAQEKRAYAYRKRFAGYKLGYIALKLFSAHIPAIRTLLPDTLKPGDEVQVVWTDYDETTRRYGSLQRKTAKLARPDPKAKLAPGEIAFEVPLEGVPGGAAVIGPEGMGVGMVTGGPASGKRDRFLSFAVLNQATNCVVPVPTTDKGFEEKMRDAAPPDGEAEGAGSAPPEAAGGDALRKQGSAAPGNAGAPSEPARVRTVGDMVEVPGGPIRLPLGVLTQQSDMWMAKVACVAPFLIDKYEVTNKQYYAFWKSLPESERKKPEVREGCYPLGWADGDPPFPEGMSDVPVLGVRLPGAAAYARSKGKRLPTPYEWCLAALGPNGEEGLPAWVKRYLADRNETWTRVHTLHLQYALAHFHVGTLGGYTVDEDYYNHAGVSLPWFMECIPWFSPYAEFRSACRWSKETVLAETEHLWKAWVDPPYVLSINSRAYDASPYGVKDVMMNASDLVVSSPEPPYLGTGAYMKVDWIPADPVPEEKHLVLSDWWPHFHHLFARHFKPLLSRRIVNSSAKIRPQSTDEVPSFHEAWVELWSHLFDEWYLLQPLSRYAVTMNLAMTAEFALDLPGSDDQVGIALDYVRERYPAYHLENVPQRRLPIPVFDVAARFDEETGNLFRGLYFDETPAYALWSGPSPHLHPEMGRPFLVDPPVHLGARPQGAFSNLTHPKETYLFPNGFRCAR